MILYKYRADNENTEQIIKNKQVWLATPDSLNDPFECSYNIPLRHMEAHVESWCEHQITAFAMTCAIYQTKGIVPFGFTQMKLEKFWNSMKSPLLSKQGRYQLLLDFQMKNGVKFSDQQDVFYKFKDLLKKVGIFSLSAEIDNQLLWAHYADESRGIAIGFNATDNSKLLNPEHCMKVDYSDAIPEKSDIGFSDETHISFDIDENTQDIILTNKNQIAFYDSFFQKVVATKPTPWAYEKEWRYIEATSGLHPLPARISEIVFGVRATEDTIKKYINLADTYHNDVKFYKIKKSETKNLLMRCRL